MADHGERKPSSGHGSRRKWGGSSRRVSVLPLKWRVRHNASWTGHLLASGFSLLAFILLLVMVFSKSWLYPSKIRYYQRWSANVSNVIHNSVHILSLGLLQFGKSQSSYHSKNGRDTFNLWRDHLFLGLANITFSFTLVMGIILALWLHLPYLPGCQRLRFFVWTGTVMSVCEAVFILSTLLLFPINLWIFEVRVNISVPLGWSYFIGWFVYFLYVICGIICYWNHRHFKGIMQSHSSDTNLIDSRSS